MTKEPPGDDHRRHGRVEVTLGNHRLHLMGDGAVFWPSRRTLLVADTHFGKESTFRRAAIPVPSGATGGTLATLDRLIERTGPRRLVFLGDLFHDRRSLSRSTTDHMNRFFDRHESVSMTLVRGNHDTATGRLPSGWPIEDVGPRWRIGSVALEHYPADPPDGCDLLMCGHLHPAVRLRHGDDRLGKLACFWFRSGTLVLPAIGDFTGTATITPRDDDRVFLWVENKIIPHRWDVARDEGRRGGRMRPPTTGSAKSPRRLVR